MEYIISEYITIWEKYSIYELSAFNPINGYVNNSPEIHEARMVGNPTRIKIKDEWYDAIPLHIVARSKSEEDDSFHFIYIEINIETNEYYIGKVNRKRWSELKRYKGSGLLFKNKYKGHESEFVQYFIVCCASAKDTEEAEAKIVDSELLNDPKCLNLVQGGGGTNEHYSSEKRSAFQSQYMKTHPECFQSMVEVAKELYQSGETEQLKQRSEAIKNTMSDDYYRKMMSDRIKNWIRDNPEEYKKSRENNLKAIRSPETKAKKAESRKRWIEEHPEEYEAQKKIFAEVTHTPEVRKKRSDALKAWNKDHPEESKANAQKRSTASAEKCRKAVNMCDLETGEVIRRFNSIHEAAQWLLDNGISNSINCASSISAVCQRKPCTTGYGYRKKAFGFDWHYAKKSD